MGWYSFVDSPEAMFAMAKYLAHVVSVNKKANMTDGDSACGSIFWDDIDEKEIRLALDDNILNDIDEVRLLWEDGVRVICHNAGIDVFYKPCGFSEMTKACLRVCAKVYDYYREFYAEDDVALSEIAGRSVQLILKILKESAGERLTFVDNADELVRDLLYRQSTTAWYKGLLDSMNNSYATVFATSFQNYVTRLGLIVHEVASKKFSGAKTKHCNYVEVLRYICKDILEDDSLYKKLEKLNKPANDAKHSTKNVRIDINKFVTYFNVMIDNLVSVSGCKAFGIYHLYVKQNKNIERKIICHCCGLVNLTQYHQCPECKKYVCVDCFDRKRRMCAECKAAAAPKKMAQRTASSEAGGEVAGMVLIRGAGAVSDFYLCDHAVTQTEYERVMGKNPSECVGEKLPVTKVTLYDAIEYCNQLSKREGLRPFYRLKGLEISCSKTSDGYRLPTGAEWLFAAADLKDCDSLEEYAWFKQAGSRSEPMEVCLKKQNDKGLYDLLGNVSEWCYDFRAKKTFDYGGSFNQKEELIRQMANGNKNPLLSYDRVGFRVARNAD